MLNLLKHELQSRTGATIGWGIGLILFGALYIGIFPEVGEQMAGLADLSIYKAMGMDVSSFAGFIASVLLQFLPLLLGIYAITTSTQTLAGEEDNGTLELVLAMPIKRWQIVAVKACAIAVVAFIILVIAGAGNALVLNAIKATIEVDVTFRPAFSCGHLERLANHDGVCHDRSVSGRVSTQSAHGGIGDHHPICGQLCGQQRGWFGRIIKSRQAFLFVLLP